MMSKQGNKRYGGEEPEPTQEWGVRSLRTIQVAIMDSEAEARHHALGFGVVVRRRPGADWEDVDR